MKRDRLQNSSREPEIKSLGSRPLRIRKRFHRHRWNVLAILGMVLTGCATPLKTQRPSFEWDILRGDQMDRLQCRNALQVVKRFRPAWLAGRRAGVDPTSPRLWVEDRVQVYLDGTLTNQGADVLQEIPVQDILEIRFLSPMDATTRFGIGHTAGAILVETRAR